VRNRIANRRQFLRREHDRSRQYAREPDGLRKRPTQTLKIRTLISTDKRWKYDGVGATLLRNFDQSLF
jgi:hypothetical protein